MSGLKDLKGPGPAKVDLTGIKQSAPVPSHVLEQEQKVADRVAAARNMPGEPVGRVPLKRGSGVRDRVLIEGPIEIMNDFRTFCNRHDVSMAAGLALLMKQSGG
jgi:hypothetical protein